MSKRTDKRIGHAAVAFAAVTAMILFAACSPDAAHDSAMMSASPRQDATGATTEGGPSRHAAIERRHFDIYDHYRKLSDQRDVGAAVRQKDDEGMRQALMTMNGFGLDLMPACSMRALLTGD